MKKRTALLRLANLASFPFTRFPAFGLKFAVVGFAFAMAASASAQNLLTNGSFEAGNTGFNTDYANYYNGTSNLNTYTSDGSYTVGTNPSVNSVASDNWANIGDHTTGAGNMLEMDGDSLGNRFWYETVAVIPNTTYTFSYWATTIDANTNGGEQLQLTLNGTAVGSANSPNMNNVFVNYTATWNSGTNTTATVALSDLNTGYGFNDFAVDDMSFAGPSAVPEPTSTTLALVGMACAVFYRRRAMRSR